ncbi:Rieske (2Fe-2S) protein [Mycobacterium sp. NS-7484]|uniref:aromatic ring-hydroxylating oxygenase subunit alpha n=1 Tax=Mycobacterium sp. NS-7484 TaxID=1834161 RepID=UPI00096C7293|nr:aromatic ring-hydroxylating dioxygenase subunit alpha [Mycobacterium sp. NS-7484]OMB97179.1 Rieske (2Fe-2S) protein [Mycobacterium sp. NS-7484]
MPRNLQSPIPLQAFDTSDQGIDTAISMPPAVYTSEEFHQFELDAVWGHEWFCIGRAADIPNAGDFFTVTVANDPLMAVRGRDGVVRVLANVCQHRAMLLVEGSGNRRRFQCPYHSWVYGLDGQLQSAPQLNDSPCFNKADVKLPEVRSELWEGFIFVTFDDTIPSLTERLGGLSDYLANWDIASLHSAAPQQFTDYNFNWKLFGDECYHCQFLHSQSWVPMYPTSAEQINFRASFNDADKGVIGYELISVEEGASPTKTGRVMQPFLPNLTSEQRSKLAYVTVAPNLLIIAMPDKVKYFHWLPGTTAGTSQFAATWMYPESTLALPNFDVDWKQEVEDLAEVMREDEMAWNGTQSGMRSRFAPRGRYAPPEEVLVALNHWLVRKYRAADQQS